MAQVILKLEIPRWRIAVAQAVMGACEAACVASLGAVDLDACAERLADWVIAGARAK